MDKLMARLHVALRVAPSAEELPVIETPDFTIDLSAKRVQRNGKDVRLTATEWQVVELLARDPGKLLTQRQLLEKVLGLSDVKTNYVRVFMGAIQRKLEPDASHPPLLPDRARLGLALRARGCRSRSRPDRTSDCKESAIGIAI